MKVVKSNKGVIIMGDKWDYKLQKADMIWELALRIVPDGIQDTGAWTDQNYLKNTQKTLEECRNIIDAVFTEDQKVKD